VFISTYVALFSLVFILWTLLSANVALTLIALSIAPPLMVTNVIFGRRLKRRTLEAREVETEFTTTVQRSISSVGLVQAFCREQEEYARFRSTVRKNIDAWWRLNWQEMFYWLIVGLIFGLGGAAVFGYGGYLVWRNMYVAPGCRRPDRGRPDGLVSYLALLWDPLCKITGIGPNIQAGVAGAQRVFEVLDRESAIRDEPGQAAAVQPRVLELQDVSFAYGSDTPVLRGVNCGSSGRDGGLRRRQRRRQEHRAEPAAPLLRPHRGAFCLDGHNMRDVKLGTCAALALVLQDSVLLPTTIAENIAYGRARAAPSEIATPPNSPARPTSSKACLMAIRPASPRAARISRAGSASASGGRALLTNAPIIVRTSPPARSTRTTST